jgi:hypothetical protein
MAKKKVPAFDPKRSPLKSTTLARQVARQNLTTLNNALWVTENSHSLVRTGFARITTPMGIKAHGCFGSEPQWSSAVDEQHLWVRQHVLVSAASLLEVYLGTATSAALWASPEYADRSLSGLREVELIKFSERARGLTRLIGSHVRTVLNGRWINRFRQMAIVFGKLPPKLVALTDPLQDLQDKRNRIAHSFGQDTKIYRRTPWAPTDAIKLDVSDVEKVLTLVNEAIREADLHLLSPLIGGYEFLYEYHAWLKAFDPFSRPAPDVRHRSFRKHIGEKFGFGPDKKYYQSLVRYYEECT